MSGDNLIVKVSAPGKVILYGEHSVVYNKLAIASSLGLRTKVTLQENKTGILKIDLNDLNFVKEFDIKDIYELFEENKIPLLPEQIDYVWTKPSSIDYDKFVEKITETLKLNDDNYKKNQSLTLTAFFYLYFGILLSNNVRSDGLNIDIKTDLSIGAGTGSSASLMVSLSGAFLRYLTVKQPSNKPTKITDEFNRNELGIISDWAFQAERIIHGNPSGIDNTICSFGSMVSFRKGHPPNYIKTTQEICCILVDTRVPKNTGVQVKKVAVLKERHPKIIESILESMDELTNEAVECLFCLGLAESRNNLKDYDQIYNNLNELTDINQSLLRALNVSHPSLEDVISILSTKELHGKITGAGGGGYAYAFIPPSYQFNELDTLCSELSSKGYQPLITKLGGPGVTVDYDFS